MLFWCASNTTKHCYDLYLRVLGELTLKFNRESHLHRPVSVNAPPRLSHLFVSSQISGVIIDGFSALRHREMMFLCFFVLRKTESGWMSGPVKLTLSVFALRLKPPANSICQLCGYYEVWQLVFTTGSTGNPFIWLPRPFRPCCMDIFAEAPCKCSGHASVEMIKSLSVWKAEDTDHG